MTSGFVENHIMNKQCAQWLACGGTEAETEVAQSRSSPYRMTAFSWHIY